MTSSDRWRRIDEVFTSAVDIPWPNATPFWTGFAAMTPGCVRKSRALLAHGGDITDGEESPVISSIIEGAAGYSI